VTKTKIEWGEYSWNPITGCTPISPGCTNCYAQRMARRLAGRCGYPKYPHHFDVTLHPGRLGEPLRRKKPTMYFVCSMSDFFHEDVPWDFRQLVLSIIAMCPQHTFLFLTKRPQNALEFLTWPGVANSVFTTRKGGFGDEIQLPFPNIWLGVSIESQPLMNKRILPLLQIPAVVRFVNLEPLLEAIDLNFHSWSEDVLRWVLVGGESGLNARPMNLDWVRNLMAQCRAADVPIFVKQLGSVWAREHNECGKGNNPATWPEDLRVREYPVYPN